MIDNTWLPGQIRGRFSSGPTEVVANVWVGDQIDARAAWFAPGWTVIDVRETDTSGDPPSVVRIALLRPDTKFKAGRKALNEIADAIDRALLRGDQVLVHCWAGIERSPLSLVWWLVTRQDFSLTEAYRLLQAKRGVADRRAWLTKKARRQVEAA